MYIFLLAQHESEGSEREECSSLLSRKMQHGKKISVVSKWENVGRYSKPGKSIKHHVALC